MLQTRIIIADDHALIREGLESLLTRMKDCLLAGVCKDGIEAMRVIRSRDPDIAFVDVKMPGLSGIDVANQVKRESLNTKVILISSFDDDRIIAEIIESGAKGFILKSSDINSFEKAIHMVSNGDEYYCREALEMYRLYMHKKKKLANSAQAYLDEREIEVLRLICRQKITREIAAELHLSEKSIEAIRSSVMTKMDVKNVAGMIIFAIANRIISVEEILAT